MWGYVEKPTTINDNDHLPAQTLTKEFTHLLTLQMMMCFKMLKSREPETELVGANHAAGMCLQYPKACV